jgi:hypothetical protein
MEHQNKIQRAPARENEVGAAAGPPEDLATTVDQAGEVQKETTAEADAPTAIDPGSQVTTLVTREDGSQVLQHTAAASDATVTIEVAQPEPPDRDLAAEMVSRFLGHQGSRARDEVADLNDAEAWDVIRAAGDRYSARAVIKSVIGRAYDRRRDEAAKASQVRREEGPQKDPDPGDGR